MRNIILVILLSHYAISCNPDEKISVCTTDCSSSSVLIVPSEIDAGDTMVIELDDVEPQQDLHAYLSSPFGTIEVPINIKSDGTAILTVTPTRAGIQVLNITCCNVVLHRRTIVVHANAPEGTIQTYTGPKTIYTSGKESSMLVYSIVDKFGNPTSGSNQTVSLVTSGEVVTLSPERVESFYFTDIPASTDAGKQILGITAKSANSVEEAVEVHPSFPVMFELEFNNVLNYCDSRYRFQAIAGPVSDNFRNTVPDGTLVSLDIAGKDGYRSIHKSPTINGYAQFDIQNPDNPTSWEIRGMIGPVILTKDYELTFESAVKTIEYNFDFESSSLSIGPVVSYHGGAISDGSIANVTFRYEDDSSHSLSCQIIEGHGDISCSKLNMNSVQSITIECGGKTAVLYLTNGRPR